MPLYAYKCRSCGEDHEALQKIGDDPVRLCPHCGQPTLERQLTAPIFRLKGTGWYETDFKTDNKRHLAGNEKDDKPQEKNKESQVESSGDSKKTDTAEAKNNDPQNKDAKQSEVKSTQNQQKDTKSTNTSNTQKKSSPATTSSASPKSGEKPNGSASS